MDEDQQFKEINIEHAYGLLWLELSPLPLVKQARHALFAALSLQQRKNGIAWAVETYGPITNQQIIAADIRDGIFPNRSYP